MNRLRRGQAPCYGIASQRYENRVDLIEGRANSILAELSIANKRGVLSRISGVQNLPCPRRPHIWRPQTVIGSLFCADTLYIEVVDRMKQVVEHHKSELSGVFSVTLV